MPPFSSGLHIAPFMYMYLQTSHYGDKWQQHIASTLVLTWNVASTPVMQVSVRFYPFYTSRQIWLVGSQLYLYLNPWRP